MTAPLPVPSNRPRLVDAAFWVWLVAAMMLVAFGLLLATSGGGVAFFYRGFGILFALAGCALGFAGGKSRTGHRGFRRVRLGYRSDWSGCWPCSRCLPGAWCGCSSWSR